MGHFEDNLNHDSDVLSPCEYNCSNYSFYSLFFRLAPRGTKCPHITPAEAMKRMSSIQEKFKEDIAHYSKHGLLYLESGPYDIEEKSAQELMNRHDRMCKLQKELEERRSTWPDIFCGKRLCFLIVPLVYMSSYAFGQSHRRIFSFKFSLQSHLAR